MSCKVTLKIKVPSDLCDEIVGVVGNVKELGSWKLSNAVSMKQNCASDSERWEIIFNATNGDEIQYRYFTGRMVKDCKNSTEQKMIVSSWEVHLNSRNFVVPNEPCFEKDDGTFGVCEEKKAIDKGWLTCQQEFRFSISHPKNMPFIEFLNDEQSQADRDSFGSYRVAVGSSSTSKYSTLTKITPYNYTRLKGESEWTFAVPASEDVHYLFTVETLQPAKESVKFHILDQTGEKVGTAVLSCRCLPTSKGIAKIPVLNNEHNVVAVLRVPYLCITPNPSILNMQHCFTKHWKPRPMVHIGHRGSGNSFSSEKLASVFENTLASFLRASRHGAQFVEFDVHLCKDGIPVIYHDLTSCVSAIKKGKSMKTTLLELPVHTLTFDQLQSLHMRHRNRIKSDRKLMIDEYDLCPQNQPFLTLEELMQKAPEKTGFNIEVKYPYLNEDNEYEDDLEHYVDANVFVDAILKVVFQSAGSRKVIFSSFNVDICTMLRRKQNRYPVLFLTNGDTLHYTPMLDLRESTNRMAIGTALAEGFLGINSLEKDVYKTPEIVQQTHDAGLVFSCYGDDVGDNLKLLKSAGVDIAIYDRIYEYEQVLTNGN